MQLTVIEYAGKPAESKTSVEFLPPGGTIGRNADNQLVLPDETRRISRLQALLQTDGTHCQLKNLSSVALVQINDVSLDCAQEHVVRPGDAIRIGPYVLRADWDSPHRDEAPTARASRARAANEDAPRTIPTDPLALFMPAAAQDAPSPDSADPVDDPTQVPAPSEPVARTPPGAQHAVDGNGAGTAYERHVGAPDPSTPQAPATRREADALLAAFLHGAGLDRVACDWSTDQLKTAGQLLSLFANGTVELLSSRSILKREVKADMTILLDRENNPLKLLPDGSAALKQMFGLPFPGFMTPSSAVEDAFHDLHAHQIAIVAGMRAALIDLLARSSPERMAARAGAPNRLERALPVLRAASLWRNFTRLHREMTLAVEDDFGAVFGKAFLNAYDEEVKTYHTRRENAGAS
ncbi:type VI secretion system-associated FHA domain protein TagH [Trinickia sp. Y13]|uniref:type VI secretion system-associated FHA domain protein TagH n=1 Tax=Trinickia sp. Y13 TaxID=2917807 RepID=UPI0024052678|nr:type VI secretion system-associated FHA domain protein TagH [Trinickia sp. Y13]MDG0023197.1 type VI secretion system-associated FHA domain protein TagH [Trinickia sp. Y13]